MEGFTNEDEFIIHEVDNELLKKTGKNSNYEESIDASEEMLSLCWGIKVLDICIEKANDYKLVLIVKLAGKTIGRFTLTRKKTCVKLKESVGGDLARIDIKICANFNKRKLYAKGKVCTAFICTTFNQRILKW
jgi:hypothetical protein